MGSRSVAAYLVAVDCRPERSLLAAAVEVIVPFAAALAAELAAELTVKAAELTVKAAVKPAEATDLAAKLATESVAKLAVFLVEAATSAFDKTLVCALVESIVSLTDPLATISLTMVAVLNL